MNYNNMFSVGRMLILQGCRSKGINFRNGEEVRKLANDCFCEPEVLHAFLSDSKPLSGRDWDMVIRTVDVSQDEWLSLAQAEDTEIEPKVLSLGGCGEFVEPAVDDAIRNVFGLLDGFYEQASSEFLAAI